ncbi:uncharacterized protein IUM83_01053 [Phytophthora cinnamomi]|uniref:uncharacterized protein n=1 Tax=Phytophthora cinnamomi TaxID=4785 RepID=UPI003559F76D|nr:hypothetical protein IUM83_01053 [Phytophthora cinnamomi]
MSGLTPTAFENEPSGLQDVLAFIADFEMEDASSANHDSDDWMEDDVPTADQQSKGHGGELPEFFGDGGRRPSPTTSFGGIGPHQALLLSTSTAATSSKGTGDVNAGAAKTSRRHRVSRKEELEYLRKKVTDMELKLKQLKNNAEGGGSPAPAKPATPEDEKAAMQLEQSIALWKKMAERQKSQREVVESENAKLREKLKTQVRMAKSLQRILRKRERTAEQITSEAPKRFKQLSQGAYCSSGGEFDALVQNLEALYTMTNERMSTCPVATGSQPLLREQDGGGPGTACIIRFKTKDNSVRATPVACLGTPHVRDAQIKRILTGEYLEFQDSRFLPFTIDIVNQAMWRFLREAGISSNHYNHDHQEKQDDTILRTYGIEIEKNNGVPNLQGKQSMRRYFRGTSVVIVRKSVILPAGANGVEFVEKGWIVLSPAPGQAATVIQEFSTISPRGHHMKCGLITDGMIATREEMVDKAFPILENILFEEAGKTLPSYSE